MLIRQNGIAHFGLRALLLLSLPAIGPAQQIAIGGYPLPTIGSFPNWITTGPDGALWFCGSYIGRMTTAGASKVESGYSGEVITPGPDGALWFTDQINNAIGRVTT